VAPDAALAAVDERMAALYRWALHDGAEAHPMDRVLLLHSIPLFADASADQLLTIAGICRGRRYGAGETVFAPGDAATDLYLIERGAVEILREDRVVARFEARGAFGELAILGDARRNTTARAAQDTDCLLLSRGDFQALLDVSPELAKATIATLARRLREALERLG
jgi:CRP-like cAMP-binding protein